MRKIENPSEYEVCKISEWGEVTGVYAGGFSDHEKIDLKWHTANDRDYLTLSEIAEQVDATIITVFVDNPFDGKILQYGNYGADWWEIGKTEGYA